MRILIRLLDVVYYPDGPIETRNNIILDNNGNIDIYNVLLLSVIIFLIVVLSGLIIRRIRRRLGL